MAGSGATRSAWMDGVSLIPGDGPLPGDAQADVCVIGAGVAGLTTAYLLVREGRSVIVVDDGPPGMGETLRTTAHLTAAIDDRIHVLEGRFGARKTRLAVASQVAAIDRIERICADEHLDGIFRRVDGHLFLNPAHGRDILEKELAAARRAGLADARIDEATPLPGVSSPCLVFPRQAELDAGAYMAGLADAIRRKGGRIHATTHVLDLEEGEPIVVRTANGRIECESVVVCTNAPVFGKVALHTKQEQFRTYVVAYEVPRGAIPRGLYWDTTVEGAGYHYIRLADRAEPGSELLIVGGEDHRVGEDDPKQRTRRLETWCSERFGVGAPTYRWSGQVIEPVDHLPFLGRYPGLSKDVYVITGDSGQGFTNHTCGAMLVTDLIQGRRNPWQGLYSPSRQGLTRLFSRLRANTRAAVATARDKLEPGEVRHERDIPLGTGAILERDGRKIACYREPSGELRECAAECTHMGAIVHWNALEKSWDCPWHGSRFTATGQVINGPANKPLDAPGDKENDDMTPTATKNRKTTTKGRTGRPGRKGHATRPRSMSRAKRTQGPAKPGSDAIALMKADHRKVKGLLKKLDAAEDGDRRQGLFEDIEQELLVHARLEEELFYPRFKQAVGDDDEETKRYFEAHEEHEVAERVAAEIREHPDPASDEYAAKCKVLKDLIEHHIEEEEEEMFPSARKAIGRQDLLHLGEDMRQRKQEMLAGDVDDLRRIEAPRDAIEPGTERRDTGHGETAQGSTWQRMRRRGNDG